MTDDADGQRNQGEPEQEQAPEQRTRGKFRPGQSGNPSGRRRGKVTRQTIAALVREYGSPLEFLLKTMADTDAKMADRLRAAESAIGYVHRRLPEYADAACPPIEEPSKAEIARIEAWRKQHAPKAAPGSDWPALRL
jgi:hypothetical protein